MGGLTSAPVRVHDARDLAQVLLDGQAERWRHTIGVARRAEQLAAVVDGEAELLIAAAWLHDIGYSPVVHDTGFHPLDGARYLDRRRWPSRLAALVAHHSGACFVASAIGLEAELGVYPREVSPVSDALTYADQTVGPGGRRMTLQERVTDMLRRHGPDSPNARVHAARWPYLLEVAERVRSRSDRDD
jgi:putative nucleotidyltransferase with HDIG domain